MKSITILSLSLSGLLLMSCFRKKNFDGKVLNLVISQTVKGMDPIYASDLYSGGEIARVYEGLFEYNYVRPYEVVPNLAGGMPVITDNGLTYTFKILQGVFFHDSPAFPQGKGRELTAQDFVYSLKRLADAKLQGLGWWIFDGKVQGLNEWRDKYKDAKESNYGEDIDGLKALDKYTLQIKLTRDFPQLLYALAMPFSFVVAREVATHYGPEFLNYPVGTAAFTLERFNQSNKITYKKNPNFRKKTFPCNAVEKYKALVDTYCGKQLPFVDKIVVNVIVEDQPRWLNFQKGKIDMIAVPKDNFESVIPGGKDLASQYRDKEISLIIAPSLDVTYTGFNHDMPLFKNKTLRQAMMLAYDSEKANKLFYNDTALSAHSIIPPGIPGFIENFESPYRYKGPESLKKAKQLLNEAGYPEGKGLPKITLDIPSSTVSRQMGEFFVGQMKTVNINIRLNKNTWPELQNKIVKRQIQLYSIAWGADYPDAENFLQLLYGPNKSPGANGSGYDNPVYNKLFKQASLMQHSPARTTLYEKLNLMAAEAVPIIFGVHRQKYVLKHSWITNYIVSDFDHGNAQYIDINSKKKQEILKRL